MCFCRHPSESSRENLDSNKRYLLAGNLSSGKHRPGRNLGVFYLRDREAGKHRNKFPAADRPVQTAAVHGPVFQLGGLPDTVQRAANRHHQVL